MEHIPGAPTRDGVECVIDFAERTFRQFGEVPTGWLDGWRLEWQYTTMWCADIDALGCAQFGLRRVKVRLHKDYYGTLLHEFLHVWLESQGVPYGHGQEDPLWEWVPIWSSQVERECR